MEYYYTDSKFIDSENKTLTLTGFEYHHLVNVLRKTAGDIITVTDGKRNIFYCSIVEITGTEIRCKFDKTDYNVYEPDIFIKLYISPLRNQARFEFAIEKAVELGVGRIIPVILKNTVKKTVFTDNKIKRTEKIIVGAMGQSQRCFLPSFSKEINLSKLLSDTKNEKNKLILYEFSNNMITELPDKSEKSASILIGPEGGFDKTEIELLKNNLWKLSSLGQRKIRSETAAIIAIFRILNLKLI